jgi:hypothetical protein
LARDSETRNREYCNLSAKNARSEGTKFGGVIRSLLVKFVRRGLKSLVIAQNISKSAIVSFSYRNGVENSLFMFLYLTYSAFKVV